jgi:broad specificity phosphatase PhoE
MTQIPLKPFYFLRHGETDWNREHKAMGSQDIPLNDRGLSQALIARELLKNKSIGTIVSSPLLRARQTADIIQQSISAPVMEITELQEACWGEKEGGLKGNGLWINAWREGEEIKDAEQYTDFVGRVTLGLEKALQYPGPVLIVSHGGVYWGVQHILALPMVDLGNCELVFHQPPHHPSNPWGIYPLSEGRDFYEYE